MIIILLVSLAISPLLTLSYPMFPSPAHLNIGSDNSFNHFGSSEYDVKGNSEHYPLGTHANTVVHLPMHSNVFLERELKMQKYVNNVQPMLKEKFKRYEKPSDIQIPRQLSEAAFYRNVPLNVLTRFITDKRVTNPDEVKTVDDIPGWTNVIRGVKMKDLRETAKEIENSEKRNVVG